MTKRFKRDAGRRRRSGRIGSKPDSGNAEITIFVLEGIIFRLKGTLLLSPLCAANARFFFAAPSPAEEFHAKNMFLFL